jgi:hypothetical protein
VASGTYTLQASELQLLDSLIQTVYRTPEYRQLLKFFINMDSEYGISSNNGLNNLVPRAVNKSTGVVTWNSADANYLHEYKIFP